MDITPRSVIKALSRLGNENNHEKRAHLLNNGLKQMMKWFMLASKNILDNKIILPKPTKKFMDKHKHKLEQIVDDSISLETKRDLILTPGGMGFLGGGLIKTLIKWDGKKMIRSFKSRKQSPNKKSPKRKVVRKKNKSPRRKVVRKTKSPLKIIIRKVVRKKKSPKRKKKSPKRKTILNSDRKNYLNSLKKKAKYPVIRSLLNKPIINKPLNNLTDLISENPFILDNQYSPIIIDKTPKLQPLSPGSVTNVLSTIEKTNKQTKYKPITLPLTPNFHFSPISSVSGFSPVGFSPNNKTNISNTPNSLHFTATAISPRSLFQTVDKIDTSFFEGNPLYTSSPTKSSRSVYNTSTLDNNVQSFDKINPTSYGSEYNLDISNSIALFKPLTTPIKIPSNNYIANKPMSQKHQKFKDKLEKKNRKLKFKLDKRNKKR